MSAGRMVPTNVSAATPRRELSSDARLIAAPWSANAVTVSQAHTHTHSGAQSASCASSQSAKELIGVVITSAASVNAIAFANQITQLSSLMGRVLSTPAFFLAFFRFRETQPLTMGAAPTMPRNCVAPAAWRDGESDCATGAEAARRFAG